MSTSGSGIDPLRRKTTHIPPSAHQHNQRRLVAAAAGDLVKVGHKLTSDSVTSSANAKANSFIVGNSAGSRGGVQGLQTEASHHHAVAEEKQMNSSNNA